MVKGVTSSGLIPCDFSEHSNVPGFNEFQEESDIAFYTGILGWPGAFVLGRALTPPSSGCIFSHAIPHLSTMGMYRPFPMCPSLVCLDVM